MAIDRVFIATHRHDLRLTRICVASIRCWYPDIPIYLIKDYFNGDFSTQEIERVWNVSVYGTENRCYGWGMSKLEPVFNEKGSRFLVLDSDTVFTGKVIDHLEKYAANFVVHLQNETTQRVNEIYFDQNKVRAFDPEFEFAGETFNTGQYVATGGLLKREDFTAVNWTTTPPSLKYPDIFKNGEQGVLNYVLLKKAAAGELTVEGTSFMRWPPNGLADIEIEKLNANSEYTDVIHWAGLRRPRLGTMVRSDILKFFESYYYSKLRYGALRKQFRASADIVTSINSRLASRTNRLRTGFLNRRGPAPSSPSGPSAEVSVN